MGRSQNLGKLVCGSVSYTLVLSFHMVLSYSRVSTVCQPDIPPNFSHSAYQLPTSGWFTLTAEL